MDTFEGPQLTFEWSPTLVEGSESDGETMLYYESDPMREMEYEYPEDDTDNSCYNSEIIGDKAEGLRYPTKRKQRRAQLNCLHCYVAHTGAVAVAASASIMAEDVASGNSSTSRSIAAANTAILACMVGGVVAVLGNLFSSFAHALASSAQRGEALEYVPLGRSWLRNSCGLFCVASILRFIIGFLPDPIELMSMTRSSESVLWLLPDGSTEDFFLRVLCVVALSLISGCFLGLRSPLQSALLCGL
jgi:hypothetical protein